MRILILINWKIHYLKTSTDNIQPSDYCSEDEKFWFFKYFNDNDVVEVLDTSSNILFSFFEKKIRCYFLQGFKALNKIKKNRYDLIFIHGTNSAIFIGFLKRLFRIKTPPIIVVDISSFHKSSTKGLIFKLCQYASKSFTELIYHCSSQKDYFLKYFPWLKINYVQFGINYGYWANKEYCKKNTDDYFVCAGYRMRDWNTLLKSYQMISTEKKLVLLGKRIKDNIPNVYSIDFMPINEYNQIIINSYVSILPLINLNYSFGQMTLLQQLALGKVIICAESNAIKDYINSPGIIKYKCEDFNDLKNKLEYVLKLDKKEIVELGNINKEYVKNELSEECMAKKIYNICLRCLNSEE